MNIFHLSFRNMTNRPLSTILSLVLLTLGVGIIALLLQLNRHIQEQMENNIRGIDMVVGAKGSPLQLILSAVYHIDAPTGNIPLHEAEKLQKNGLVETVIPLSFGDNYQGFRIVGTNHDYFEIYEATLSNGQFWKNVLEVTLGATVANNLGLKVGDTFSGEHGLVEGGEIHEKRKYKVVGILNYASSVLDQLILTATESVWEVHHHEEDEEEKLVNQEDEHQLEEGHEDEHQAEEDHEGDQEVTALLIKFRNPMGMVQLPNIVNKKTNMQAAVPAFEINRLFNLMGIGINTLNTIALVIMVVSGLSVFISLYSALKDRKYEMALMRSYGASRLQLVGLILQEGMLLTLTGFFLGLLLSRLGLWLTSKSLEANYHYAFSGWSWSIEENWLLVTALIIGLVASLLPAIHVFRFNISKILADA